MLVSAITDIYAELNKRIHVSQTPSFLSDNKSEETVLRSIFACRLLGWAQRQRSMIDRVVHYTTLFKVSEVFSCAVIYSKFSCGCLRCHLLIGMVSSDRGLAPNRTISSCMRVEHQQNFT